MPHKIVTPAQAGAHDNEKALCVARGIPAFVGMTK